MLFSNPDKFDEDEEVEIFVSVDAVVDFFTVDALKKECIYYEFLR